MLPLPQRNSPRIGRLKRLRLNLSNYSHGSILAATSSIDSCARVEVREVSSHLMCEGRLKPRSAVVVLLLRHYDLYRVKERLGRSRPRWPLIVPLRRGQRPHFDAANHGDFFGERGVLGPRRRDTLLDTWSNISARPMSLLRRTMLGASKKIKREVAQSYRLRFSPRLRRARCRREEVLGTKFVRKIALSSA